MVYRLLVPQPNLRLLFYLPLVNNFRNGKNDAISSKKFVLLLKSASFQEGFKSFRDGGILITKELFS